MVFIFSYTPIDNSVRNKSGAYSPAVFMDKPCRDTTYLPKVLSDKDDQEQQANGTGAKQKTPLTQP
jgi:hypothetical protein